MSTTSDAGLIFSSKAQTTSQQSADQYNFQSRGVILVVNVPNIGSGSITVTIQGKDSISGVYYTILASAAIATNSVTVLRVYPGLIAVGNLTVSDVLPNIWRVSVNANNSNPADYSIGGSLIT